MTQKTLKIGFTILPRFGRVNAEIYKIHQTEGGKEIHIHLINQNFGKSYRKPQEIDYKCAKEWVENQLKCIREVNTNITII